MKSCFIILALVALSACSNLSKNRIVVGDMTLKGGVSGERMWGEHWKFKRLSWMHEASMWLDMSITEVTADSPFFSWATEDEKKLILSCRRFHMIMTYALDSRNLSEKDLLAQLDKQGHHQVLVPRMAANIRLHPDIDRLGMDRHHVYGLCQKGPDLPMTTDFPGFGSITIP